MEKPFTQDQQINPTEDLNRDTPSSIQSQEVLDSPAQSPEIANDEKNYKNFSRRSFIKTAGLSALAALAIGGTPDSLKAAETAKVKSQPESAESLERENKLLHKIELERSQVKPEFLKKYFEGAYKDIVIIDTGPKQVLSVYDKNGDVVSVKDEVTGAMLVLKNVKISSGRMEMETPTSSHESGRSVEKYVNHEGVPMPHAVAIDEKKGIWIHQGIRTGFPASHGCIRLDEEYAEGIFSLAKHPKDLLFVVR